MELLLIERTFDSKNNGAFEKNLTKYKLMKKGAFHLIFIAVSTVILLLINHFGYTETYMAFSLIPILIAYFLGQFSERKFGTSTKNEKDTLNP